MPALVHQIPQINIVAWRDALRSIWNADPGLVTAKITWLALYNQRGDLQKLRDTIKNKVILNQLHDWDRRMAEYGARLVRYREALMDAQDSVAPLETLVPYYADPVFEGKYGALVEDGEIPWPGFVKPAMADAMVGATLWNQLIGVIWISEALDAETKAWFGACLVGTPVNPAFSGACLVAMSQRHIGFVKKAQEKIEELGAEVTKAASDAIDAASQGLDDLTSWLARTTDAAVEGASVFLKVFGVAVVLGAGVYIYNKAV